MADYTSLTNIITKRFTRDSDLLDAIKQVVSRGYVILDIYLTRNEIIFTFK